MLNRQRCPVAVMIVLVALSLVAACTTTGGSAPPRSTSSAPVQHTSHVTSPAPSPTAPTGSTAPADSTAPTGSAAPAGSTAPSPPHPSVATLHPHRGQLTRQGLWWGVDSVAHIDDATLANVRGFYRGAPTPVLWGRYLTGDFGVSRAELAFARAHGIGVYFIVPDDNCSACGGGDACGNDSTAAQARTDALAAVAEARRLRLPSRVVLYKDIEEVGSCHGELTADYLLAWFRAVRATRYVPAFYGNSNEPSYDFPRAYCEAASASPRFARNITLAQDEPEPQLGAAQGTIGPRNAPRFAPYRPHCAALSKVRIWQYGESIDNDNWTDVDEIMPGTHGILAPDGRVT